MRAVPLRFLSQLLVIDRSLTCEWHDFYEKFMIIRKLSDRVQDVLCAVDYEHLEGREATKLLNEIRAAYEAREPKEKIKQDIAEHQKGIDATRKEARDAFEAIATREVEAGSVGARTHAQGSPDAPTPGYTGNRLDGMLGKD